MTASKIFVCHRRDDAVHQVGSLMETLGRSFGEHTLHYGSQEPSEGKGISIEGLHAMIDARAVLIMIGPQWASPNNLERLRETDGRIDPLRRWIALALTRQGAGGRHAPMLLPILLDGASMPDKASLPDDLRALSGLIPLAFSSDETRSHFQFENLASLLKRALGIASHSVPPPPVRPLQAILSKIAPHRFTPLLARLRKPIVVVLLALTGGIALSDWLSVHDAAADSGGGGAESNRALASAGDTAPPGTAK
jgi:hypothetical protein